MAIISVFTKYGLVDDIVIDSIKDIAAHSKMNWLQHQTTQSSLRSLIALIIELVHSNSLSMLLVSYDVTSVFSQEWRLPAQCIFYEELKSWELKTQA